MEIRAQSRWARRAAWMLCVALAVLFAFAGATKIVGGAEPEAQFASWGYSRSFLLFVGFCEIAGALGLLIPRLAVSACAGLGCLMLGAIYTHLVHGEPAWVAAVVLALVGVTGWLRWYDAFFTRAGPRPVRPLVSLRRADP